MKGDGYITKKRDIAVLILFFPLIALVAAAMTVLAIVALFVDLLIPYGIARKL